MYIFLIINSKELKKWLEKQGCTFEQAKGSHVKVYLNDRFSIIPMHNTDMKKGTVEGIKNNLA